MIAGVVTTADGVPVVAATVAVVNAATHADTGKATSTDAEGKYTLSEVSGQGLALSVTAPGFDSREQPVTGPAGGTAVRVDVVLTPTTSNPSPNPTPTPPNPTPTPTPAPTPAPPPAPGVVYVVSGRATNNTGSGVPVATITVTGAASKTTTSDADGRYRIENLAAGSMQIVFTAVGYGKVERSVTLTTAQPAMTVDVVLQPASAQTFSIAGRVTSNVGGPVIGATVTVKNPAPDPNAGKSAAVDTFGQYQLTNLAAGSLQLAVSAPDFVTSERTVVLSAEAPTATVDVSLTVAAYRITGTVRDSKGVAVGGALVEITASGAAANVGRSTTTDSAGAYRFDGVTFSADNTLRASATGQKTDTRALFLIMGSPTGRVDFILGTLAYSLQGTIRNRSTGEPIAGAHIFSANLGTHPNAGREAYTDSNGHYVISDLALASFSVNIQATGYISTTQSVTMTAGTETYTLDYSLSKP